MNNLLYQEDGSIATITINRQKFRNTVNSQMVARFENIRNGICANKNIRAIIITGTGDKAFCSGADRGEFRSSAGGLERLKRFSISSIVSQIDRPTLAVINGDAFELGLELALACDLRICSNYARFGMRQIMDGEIPWDGGTQRLPHLVGRGKALEMILTGETIDAKEAYRIGLVNQVIPHGKLISGAMDVARQIVSQAPIALKYAKEAVNKGMNMTLDQGLRLEADLYFLLHTTHDRTEGIQASQKKRQPRFEGR